MAQPLHRQYLSQARRLAHLDPRRPQQGNLRRAVSTAYYGLFHFLTDQACRSMVGATGERASLRHVLTRAFVHGEMYAAAKTFRGGNLPAALARAVGPLAIPSKLRDVAALFMDAQELRHLADYDLARTFVRGEVLDLIDRVHQEIDDWDAIRTDPATRLFLVSLLVWNRISGR